MTCHLFTSQFTPLSLLGMKAFLQGNRAKNRQTFNLPSVAAESTMASALHVLQLTQSAFLAHSSPQLSAVSKRVRKWYREIIQYGAYCVFLVSAVLFRWFYCVALDLTYSMYLMVVETSSLSGPRLLPNAVQRERVKAWKSGGKKKKENKNNSTFKYIQHCCQANWEHCE